MQSQQSLCGFCQPSRVSGYSDLIASHRTQGCSFGSLGYKRRELWCVENSQREHRPWPDAQDSTAHCRVSGQGLGVFRVWGWFYSLHPTPSTLQAAAKAYPFTLSSGTATMRKGGIDNPCMIRKNVPVEFLGVGYLGWKLSAIRCKILYTLHSYTFYSTHVPAPLCSRGPCLRNPNPKPLSPKP